MIITCSSGGGGGSGGVFHILFTDYTRTTTMQQEPAAGNTANNKMNVSVGDVSADATGIQLLPFPVNHFFPRSLSREWVCIWARVARISREIRIIIMCNIYYAILFLWAAALQKYCCGCLPLLWYSVWFKFNGLFSLSANKTHGFYFALFPTANLDASRSGFFFGDEYLSQWPSISKINSFLWLTHFNYRIKVFQWYQK